MIIPNIWENKKCSKPPTRPCLIHFLVYAPCLSDKKYLALQGLQVSTKSEGRTPKLCEAMDACIPWREYVILDKYGGSINGVPQNAWSIRENPIKMDDLGVPLVQETFVCSSWNKEPQGKTRVDTKQHTVVRNGWFVVSCHAQLMVNQPSCGFTPFRYLQPSINYWWILYSCIMYIYIYMYTM